MSIEFHALGSVRLIRDEAPLDTILAQPKRLALLTYLALARPRGFRSRDELLLLFWPESNERNARSSLRTALHFLRQSLGREAIVSRGSSQIALARDAVWCDAAAFETAAQEGRLEEAMALYRGPLLGNVRIDGSPEWETWFQSERSRLSGLAREAAWGLAVRAADRGDAAGVERWGSAAALHAPEDEEAVRRLMELLHGCGRRSAALAAYERLRTALAELGCEPEQATVDVAERVRTAPRVAAGGTVPSGPAVPSESPPLAASNPVGSPSPAKSARPRRWALPTILATSIVAFGLAIALLATRDRGGSETPAPRQPGLAVFPFVVRGTDDPYGLGGGFVDLLSVSLDGFESWRTIDPRAVHGVVGDAPGPVDPADGARLAERLGARYYLLGSVVGEGGRIQVTAGLYDRVAGTDPIATATAAGEQAELFRLADRLAADLAVQRAEGFEPATASATESLAALRFYLSGTRAYRAGDFEEAVGHLRMAIRADSTFALAAYWLRLSGDAAGTDPATLAMADELMADHLDRLPPRVRGLAVAHLTLRREGPFAAESIYRHILEERPEEVDAWYQLGDIIFHFHPNRGAPFTASRGAFERVLNFEPDHLEAILHLARIAAWQRDLPRIEELIGRGLALSREGEVRLELLALRAVVLDDGDALGAVLDELERAGDGRVWIVATRVAVFSGEPERSARLFEPLLAETRPAPARALAHVAFAHLALARGRPADAERELTIAEEVQPGVAERLRPWLAAYPFFTGRCEPDAPLRPSSPTEALGRPLPEFPTLPAARREPLVPGVPESFLEGLLDACHGRFTPALAAAARIEEDGEEGPRFATAIRWHVAWAGGLQSSSALPDAPLVYLAHGPLARPAWIFAEIHRREGRGEPALNWYAATVRDLEIMSLAYLGPAELRSAEVLDRMGRTEVARRRYRRFVDLWGEADPPLRPIVEEARKRLADLGG